VARTLMARLSATEEALKAQQNPDEIESGEAAAADVSDAAGDSEADLGAEPVERRASTSSAPTSQPEATDSVDELTAAYGDKRPEERDAAPAKQAPEI
jgi:hypothetical protein